MATMSNVQSRCTQRRLLMILLIRLLDTDVVTTIRKHCCQEFLYLLLLQIMLRASCV